MLALSRRCSPPAPTRSSSRSTHTRAAPGCSPTEPSATRSSPFIVAFAVVVSGITSASALARGFGGDYLNVFVDVESVVAALPARADRGRQLPRHLRVGEAECRLHDRRTGGTGPDRDHRGSRARGRAARTPAARSSSRRAARSSARPLAGAALAFYALIGFEDSVNVAEEAQDPIRIYPKVLFGGLADRRRRLLPGHGRRLDGRADHDLASLRRPAARGRQARGRSGSPRSSSRAIGLLALSNGALINMIMSSRLLYGMSRERSHACAARHRPLRPPHALGGHPVHDRDRGRADPDRRPGAARRDDGCAACDRFRDRPRCRCSPCGARTTSITITSGCRGSCR